MGASAGGLGAIKTIVGGLPMGFCLPVLVAQHISPSTDNYWVTIIDKASELTVKEADEKEHIEPGTVYIAPPNYHLLVSRDETLALSIDPKVNFARPSIDVLFESAAQVYKDQLIGVVLTGSNSDGALGLRQIKNCGGLAVVQQPDTAEARSMPEAAIAATEVDYVLPVLSIVKLLITLHQEAL